MRLFLILYQIADEEDFLNWFPHSGVREDSLTNDIETRILMKKIWIRLKEKLSEIENPFIRWLLSSFPEFLENAQTLEQ